METGDQKIWLFCLQIVYSSDESLLALGYDKEQIILVRNLVPVAPPLHYSLIGVKRAISVVRPLANQFLHALYVAGHFSLLTCLRGSKLSAHPHGYFAAWVLMCLLRGWLRIRDEVLEAMSCSTDLQWLTLRNFLENVIPVSASLYQHVFHMGPKFSDRYRELLHHQAVLFQQSNYNYRKIQVIWLHKSLDAE